jgi:sec-independent protein translocase protein TatC
LRWRIIKSLAAVLLFSIACLFFATWLIDTVLLGPTRAAFFVYQVTGFDAVDVVLQNRTITGQFFAYVGTVLATGLVLASPVVVYQAWAFLQPALYTNEKRGLRFASVAATFFFVLGLSFGFLVITPIALQFFAQFQLADNILNEFDISRYFSMVLTWTFGAGILFELPVVVYFLARIGLVTPEMLRTGRKYALLAILVISAFLTPPDPFSQVLMAAPLLGLYELAIALAAFVTRRERKRLAREAAKDAARQAADAQSPPASTPS